MPRRNSELPSLHWGMEAELQLLQRLKNDALNNGGRKPDNRTWNSWAIEMKDFFGQDVHTAQLKSKRVRMKQLYEAFEKLKTQTGLGWNPDTNTVTRTDEQWNDYIRSNPKAANFPYHGLDNYHMYQTIFSMHHAFGSMAFGVGSSIPIRSTNASYQMSPEDEANEEGDNSDNDNICINEVRTHVHATSTHDGPSVASSSRTIARRSRNRRNSNDNLLLAIMQQMADILSSYSKSSQSNDRPSLRLKCQDILGSMNLNPKVYVITLGILVKTPEWCELFLNMLEHLRMTWIYQNV